MMGNENYKKISEILRHATENKYSEFYRNKYSGAKIADFDDFLKLQFTEKNELINTPLEKRIFLPKKDISWFASTSGTSGNKPLVVAKPSLAGSNLLEGIMGMLPKLSAVLVLAHPSRVPIALNAISGKIPAYFGNPYQMPESAYMASVIAADMIYTTPDLLLKFVEFSKNRYDFSKVKLLQFYGSSLTQAHRDFFHDIFTGALLRQAYSSTETSGIGFQCEPLAKNELPVFHIYENDLFVEIVSGEIVVTHLNKQPSLLIRYKTGDLGEFIEDKCECGSPAPLVRLLGRKTLDKVKLNGVEFQISSFDIAMKNLSPYAEDSFTAHFYQEISGNKIVGRIELELNPKQNIQINPGIHAAMEEIINKNINISNRLSYKDLVAQGLFAPIRINLIEGSGDLLSKKPIVKKLVPHF